MIKNALIAVLMMFGCGILVAAPAHAATQGAQCIKLERSVNKCSAKAGKLTRKAAVQCKTQKRQYNNSCVQQAACGQPAFSCPDGVICAQVMPDPVTYASVKELKNAGAEFLYYGECLSRISTF